MNVQTQLRILAAVDANGGVLTPSTALPLGISRTLLTTAHDEGILDRPVRGVYTRPGTPIPRAAVGAARLGSEAALSHRGAGASYGWDGIPRASSNGASPTHAAALRPACIYAVASTTSIWRSMKGFS